ncbi:MAG: LysR substrate-binding domain-containing protein [Pseudomonadota bacterium]|nr:LysR substrate-binding domain-containing protein [Pseudomonadota bacterium]
MDRIGTDRLGEMRLFAEAVARGGFSAAGRALGVSPSGVSRAGARLEARLGVRLLLRTTRAMTLTAEGEAYHRAALRILADLEETERQLAEQARPRGRLRVTASISLGRARILPILPEFLDRYPGITLDLNLGDAVLDLAAGQADVAIRVGALPDSGLTARRLGASGRCVAASPAYLARAGVPSRPEDLLAHNCLRYNRDAPGQGWPFRRDGAAFSVPVRGNIEANSGATLAQLAREGAGVVRLGRFSLADDLASGRLVELLADFDAGDREPFHAVFVGGAKTPARIRAFVDFVVEKFASS